MLEQYKGSQWELKEELFLYNWDVPSEKWDVTIEFDLKKML